MSGASFILLWFVRWFVNTIIMCVGISTGNIELRGDGKFHEWSIFNQHPAGAAKIQVIDDVFMGFRAAVQGHEPVSLVLQTHPSNQQLPPVESLNYHGELYQWHAVVFDSHYYFQWILMSTQNEWTCPLW